MEDTTHLIRTATRTTLAFCIARQELATRNIDPYPSLWQGHNKKLAKYTDQELMDLDKEYEREILDSLVAKNDKGENNNVPVMINGYANIIGRLDRMSAKMREKERQMKDVKELEDKCVALFVALQWKKKELGMAFDKKMRIDKAMRKSGEGAVGVVEAVLDVIGVGKRLLKRTDLVSREPKPAISRPPSVGKSPSVQRITSLIRENPRSGVGSRQITRLTRPQDDARPAKRRKSDS